MNINNNFQLNTVNLHSALPTVSVLMIAYNQGKYIAEAIQGVMAQRGQFKLRLIIGEDYGNDATRQICEGYARKYPDKILLLPSDRNYGIQRNFIRVLQACFDSDYLAICEGDDKWTDPDKIDSQLEFLQGNKEYVAHSHNVIKRNLITGEDSPFGKEESCELDFDELFCGWTFHAVSLVVKTDVLKNIPLDRLPYFISADRFLNRWIACHGRLFYDGEKYMAVYHRHDSGASQNSNRLVLRYQERDMLNFFDDYVSKENWESLIKSKKNALQDIAYFSALENGDMKNRFKVLAQYIFITRLSKLSNVYYVLLIMLGHRFYRFHQLLKN